MGVHLEPVLWCDFGQSPVVLVVSDCCGLFGPWDVLELGYSMSEDTGGAVGSEHVGGQGSGEGGGPEDQALAVVVLACASGMAMPTSIRKGSVPPLLPLPHAVAQCRC